MSLVTEVVLYSQTSLPVEVRRYLTTELVDPLPLGREQQFKPISMDRAGGTKCFQGEVWSASFNYVAPSQIKQYLNRAPWDCASAIAIISHDNNDTMEVWKSPYEVKYGPANKN